MGYSFFLPNLKKLIEAERCMPPQGEVKHLLGGGLGNDSWGRLVTATTFTVGHHREPDREQANATWK